MHLDSRKRRILQAIIDEYIDTAEPIGSRYIARKRELGLSSATIRNEMADLEEMGYLAQPHTSSGRVPSDKGYRLYVDDLMQARELTREEIHALRVGLDDKIMELGDMLRRASAAISRLTRYTALTLTPRQEATEVTAVEVVLADSCRVCVIAVSRSGMVKTGVSQLAASPKHGELAWIARSLRARMCGRPPDRKVLAELAALRDELEAHGGPGAAHGAAHGTAHGVAHGGSGGAGGPGVTQGGSDGAAGGAGAVPLWPVVDAAMDCVRQLGSSEIYLEGAANILSFPEFRDIERAREFLAILEEKKSITHVLSNLAADENVKMLIGGENTIEEIKGCSIVSATYASGDIVFGTIGVIGPKRMEYAKVVSMIKYVNKVVAGELQKLMEDRLGDEH